MPVATLAVFVSGYVFTALHATGEITYWICLAETPRAAFVAQKPKGRGLVLDVWWAGGVAGLNEHVVLHDDHRVVTTTAHPRTRTEEVRHDETTARLVALAHEIEPYAWPPPDPCPRRRGSDAMGGGYKFYGVGSRPPTEAERAEIKKLSATLFGRFPRAPMPLAPAPSASTTP
ncbi:hypothetical protein A7982_12787 [Minicystis rosea]|nr:hypothetical protein A7982_12787 [Minicystis rosea]